MQSAVSTPMSTKNIAINPTAELARQGVLDKPLSCHGQELVEVLSIFWSTSYENTRHNATRHNPTQHNTITTQRHHVTIQLRHNTIMTQHHHNKRTSPQHYAIFTKYNIKNFVSLFYSTISATPHGLGITTALLAAGGFNCLRKSRVFLFEIHPLCLIVRHNMLPTTSYPTPPLYPTPWTPSSLT